MPAHFLSSSPSSASTSSTASPADSSDMPKDAVSASSSSGRYSEIWNYLWVPLLLSVSKELTAAKAESTILLPSDVRLGSARSSPSCPAPDPKLNFRPVVGILTHPGDGASGRLNNDTNASYIAASYVKFVESAGARVIPLIYNEPPEILHEVGFFFFFLEFSSRFFLVGNCFLQSSLVASTMALTVLLMCDFHVGSSQKLWQRLPCFSSKKFSAIVLGRDATFDWFINFDFYYLNIFVVAKEPEVKKLILAKEPDLIGPTLGCTYRKLIKPNYPQRIGFKNVNTISPKRNIEMKLVPHHLWHLPSILENLSIPFFPHNPQQDETRHLPNNLASSRVPKVLERNNHHIVNTA